MPFISTVPAISPTPALISATGDIRHLGLLETVRERLAGKALSLAHGGGLSGMDKTVSARSRALAWEV